jgi:zinc transporter ZupT
VEPSDLFDPYDPPEVVLTQPPYLLSGLGLAIGIACGLTLGRLVQDRLEGWKQDRMPMLPLGRTEFNLAYTGTLAGITLFIGGALQVFGFGAGTALLVALMLALLTGGALWVQLERLMEQVEQGCFRAVDFDNFDEFF